MKKLSVSIRASILPELEPAARKSKMTVRAYASQVLESYVATLHTPARIHWLDVAQRRDEGEFAVRTKL